MKMIIVYSSKTGNTKKVAEAIYEEFFDKASLFKVEEAPCADEFDIVLIGFWINRGKPDEKAMEYMKNIKGKKVGIFATLGAYPDSDHAKRSMINAKAMLEPQNEVVAEFICQGKVDSNILEKFKDLPKDNPHALTPERIARHKEASKHPNQTDFENARAEFRKIKDIL